VAAATLIVAHMAIKVNQTIVATNESFIFRISCHMTLQQRSQVGKTTAHEDTHSHSYTFLSLSLYLSLSVCHDKSTLERLAQLKAHQVSLEHT